jgi:hypothetical protein
MWCCRDVAAGCRVIDADSHAFQLGMCCVQANISKERESGTAFFSLSDKSGDFHSVVAMLLQVGVGTACQINDLFAHVC